MWCLGWRENHERETQIKRDIERKVVKDREIKGRESKSFGLYVKGH